MPLTVESFSPGGRDAQCVPASRVLVKDENGNPLCVVVEFGPAQYHVSHFLEPDFATLVRTFGYEPAEVGQIIRSGE